MYREISHWNWHQSTLKRCSPANCNLGWWNYSTIGLLLNMHGLHCLRTGFMTITSLVISDGDMSWWYGRKVIKLASLSSRYEADMLYKNCSGHMLQLQWNLSTINSGTKWHRLYRWIHDQTCKASWLPEMIRNDGACRPKLRQEYLKQNAESPLVLAFADSRLGRLSTPRPASFFVGCLPDQVSCSEQAKTQCRRRLPNLCVRPRDGVMGSGSTGQCWLHIIACRPKDLG